MALGFLLGRFSGHVLRSGEQFVPEEALEALVQQNIPFSFRGKISEEEALAVVRAITRGSVGQKGKKKKPGG
jgi:hypothetical protein